MTAKLAAALPKDAANGLNEHNMTLGDSYVVVALCTVSAVTEEYEQIGTTDTLRIKAIEGFPRDDPFGQQLAGQLREAYERRTGNNSLPFDDTDQD